MKSVPFLAAFFLLSLSTITAQADELDWEEVPPFPQCTITCPVQYYGAGDTCRAVGKPGQAVTCRLALGAQGYQPDGTYRQSCSAVCTIK